MAIAQSIRATEAGIAARISGLVRAYQDSRRRNRVYNETRRELGELSDRDLNDLGLHRSMISRIAREAAYGK